ncbi:MAG: 4Fe-4S dicluster domain-containing protein [Candidatus Hydrogenedentes bacterium]|nr:4Fe-4S dicluster domain-containing protein [Candidatus Hydrogenedentota bacterium]
MPEMLTATIFMALLGGLLSLGLATANRRFYVKEDPRIDDVEALLPGANCGTCGQPGCRAFAEAVVQAQATPVQCTVSAPAGVKAIAAYLGVAAGTAVKRVARLACAGGSNVAWNRASYSGSQSCRGAALVSGGGKGCSWACLGMGDCAEVCTFGAITMNQHGLPVVDEEKCTACGDCVAVCPKGLFSIHSVTHQLWVSCKSLAEGDAALAECAVACTACGRCAADAPEGAVVMINNLPVVDYGRGRDLTKEIIQRCPTGSIVWISEQGVVEKGAAAMPVIRQSPLPVVSEAKR